MSEKKPEKWKVHEDCYAINDYLTDCRCLKELYCKKEECRFYKPKSEVSWQAIENAVNNYGFKFSKKI